MLLRPIFFLLLLLSSVLAAFNHHESDCWRRDCVFRTDAGTLCFEPQDSGIAHDECPDIFLKNLTHVHLTSTVGRSITYYDNKGRMLGAATWPIPSTMAGSVFVCMTGRRSDNSEQYHTICRETYSDDDMGIPAAHDNECVSDQKPQFISDGCFSIGKPAGSDDDRKEWYEQPVVAGIFWILGVLVTLETLCLWADNAAQAIHARLQSRGLVFTAIFELLARGWRRLVTPLPTQQPATQHSDQDNHFVNTRLQTFALADRFTTCPSASVEPEVGRR